MDKGIEEFLKLHELFKSNGFSLYLVGGSVRDYLLGIPLTDLDAVTNAKPEVLKIFLKDANYKYAKYGSVSYVTPSGFKFDITTLRKEKAYKDSRHPGYIKFVHKLSTDVKRRDYTINGLYLDGNLKVIDYVHGQSDLKNKVLRMIGNPNKRLVQDPLRIIRALRFVADYDLTLDKKLESAIRNNIDLLEKLNEEKIKQDILKIKNQDKEKVSAIFDKFNIKHLYDVVE